MQARRIDYFSSAKAVTARQAAEHYGLEIDSRGYARCPFHPSERHGSLRFYADGGAHCFSGHCNRNYDAVDLAAVMLSISPLEAAKVLCSDFHLEAITGQLQQPQIARREREQREAARRAEMKIFCMACDEERRLSQECAAFTIADADKPETWKKIHTLARVQDFLENRMRC